jgi:cation-transporting ATPase 13A3/4/5
MVTNFFGIAGAQKWQMCEVRELVPGDVVAVEAGDVVPCDGLLLSGFCIVDESSLTGESLPQQKTPAQNQTDYVDKLGSSRQHFLFAGTDVVSVCS